MAVFLGITIPDFHFTNIDISRLSSSTSWVENNVVGTSLFLAYIVAALLLTTLIVWDLIHAFRSISRKTSLQQNHSATLRRTMVPACLASVSFAMLSFNMLSFLCGSYEVKSSEYGYRSIENLAMSSLLDASIRNEYLDHISQWMFNSTLFQDFAEMITMTPGRLVWTQEALLLTMLWQMAMTIEGDARRDPELRYGDLMLVVGSRRKIPHLWAYFALTQILPMSFTQNLFYVAMALHPMANPDQPVSMPNEYFQTLTTVAYGILLRSLSQHVGGAVPLSTILTTRLFLLIPPVAYQFLRPVIGSGWVAANQVQVTTEMSNTVLILWAVYFLKTESLSWTEANGNPAIRTLAWDSILGMLSYAVYSKS